MEQYFWVMGCWITALMSIFVCWGGLYKKNKSEEQEASEKKEGKGGGILPKGRSGWPLIGETLDFITSRPVTSFMDKRKSKYGEVFRTHLLGTPVIVSTDLEVNRVILQNQSCAFVPFYPKSVREMFGESSILMIGGALHRRVHGVIGSFFKSPHFKERITAHIESTVNHNLSAWHQHNNHRLVYVQDEIKQITFEVLIKVLMGVEAGSEDMEFLKREFGIFIKGLICVPIQFPGTTLYKSIKAKGRLLEMVRRIVGERKKKMNSIEDESVVEALLKEDDLDVEFISGNIIEMMIPGEETLPTAITLSVYYLSHSPLSLNQLRRENMELKKRKTMSAHPYTSNDYMSLSFTQNVISETLRIGNIVNAVWRKSIHDVVIKGYLIPRDWCVLASMSSVHMDPAIFENPYNFDPWRWQTKENLISNSFTPFGGGQRLCPGLELSRLEISIFLHHLVTTYSWRAEDDQIKYFPTVKMRRKLPIIFTPLS